VNCGTKLRMLALLKGKRDMSKVRSGVVRSGTVRFGAVW